MITRYDWDILRDYGALLLATGAEPRSLSINGSDVPHVFHVRTLADSNVIITDGTAGAKLRGDRIELYRAWKSPPL